MKEREGKHVKLRMEIAFGVMVLCVALVVVVGFGYNKYSKLVTELANLTKDKEGLETQLTVKAEENDYILEKLGAEESKNLLFENQIRDIVGTVGNLDKLSKTDKELLQKYSRVYFLNEHYVPESLATITSAYVFEPSRNHRMHTKVIIYLDKMLKAAEENGTPVKIISAYRSFAEQTSLKGQYLVTYGSGSNQFSADQGYSEHQLGTALDFTTPKLGANFTKFESTESYQWLLDNAYKYGFILSYPKSNSYYTFEPWHWRFVGKKLAERLHNEQENFYDVDQRIINNYLLTIFD